MAVLTGNPVNQTYLPLLQLPGGLAADRAAIQTGAGINSIAKLSTGSFGPDGWNIAEFNSSSPDLASAITAYDTTTINALLIVKPGTYTCGPMVFSNLQHLGLGPGVNLLFAAGQANDAKHITAPAGLTLHLMGGTLNGNYANQGSATGLSAFYTTGDKVKVLGYGRAGRITGYRGNAVYAVNCDDFLIDGVRMDNILTRCVYGQLLTAGQTLSRFTARDLLLDRTAQGASAGDGNLEVENQAGGSDVLVAPVIENIDSFLDDAAAAFHVEVYGGVVGGLTRPSIDRVYGDGGDAVLSVDHASGGIARGIMGTAQNDKGIEIAHCTDGFMLNGFWLNLESAATSNGVVIDNQNDNGNDIVVVNGTILNPTTYGVLVKGDSGTQGKQGLVDNVVVRASGAGVVGFQAEYAPGIKFGSGCRFYGSGATQEGFVVYASNGATLDCPYVEFTAAATAGIRIELTTDFVVTNANLIGGGTADDAINIIDSQRGTVNIRAKGFDAQLVGLVVNSGQTIANLDITAIGDGNSDVTLTNNGGTVTGDTIRLYVPAGWTPYGILTGPKFLRFHTTTSSSNLLVEGIFTGDPNSSPVPYAGYAYYNGNLYTNKAGTWTVVN